MKTNCILGRFLRQRIAISALVALVLSAGSSRPALAANLPISVPDSAPAAKTLTAATPVPTMPEAQNTPATVVPQEASNIIAPHVRLPMAFSDFAADYHPTELHPQWLNVEMATMETIFSPPDGKTMFVLPELEPDLAGLFQPVDISCLLGAKSRFENTTQIEEDPQGHPLGYSLPLGKVIYVLARAEMPQGINFSFHYYEAAQLRWTPNPEKDGWLTPMTQATTMTQNLILPPDGFVFIYLSSRLGPPHPDSTAQPVVLYTYLVIRVHPVTQPASAIDAAGQVTSPR